MNKQEFENEDDKRYMENFGEDPFDPKFRTGSIPEESPDEKRRREFYADFGSEILSTVNAMISREDFVPSITINFAAVLVSELAKRSGETNYLKPGDPEFGERTSIDEF